MNLTMLAVLRQASGLPLEPEVAMATGGDGVQLRIKQRGDLLGPAAARAQPVARTAAVHAGVWRRAIASIGIAQTRYATHIRWTLAGGIGAVIGVVWNYAVSATTIWRAR